MNSVVVTGFGAVRAPSLEGLLKMDTLSRFSALYNAGRTVTVPVIAAWRPLTPLARPTTGVAATSSMSWSWTRRPALLVVFGAGVVLGMVQSAVLAYLPLFTVQALGFSHVGAGVLIAASQAGGAVARLVLGAASDRWSSGRRPPTCRRTRGSPAGED